MSKTLCTSTQIPSCSVFIIDGEAYIAVTDYFMTRHDETILEEADSWDGVIAMMIQGSEYIAKLECGCLLCGSSCSDATNILRQGVGLYCLHRLQAL